MDKIFIENFLSEQVNDTLKLVYELRQKALQIELAAKELQNWVDEDKELDLIIGKGKE